MFGICKRCKKNNAHVSWCKSCDAVNSIRTGNNLIDDFLQRALHSANRHEKVVEWIPYDRLKDIKMVGRGGFGKVFSATWIDGKRISIDENGEKRENELKVALKMLEESENISGSLLKKIMKEVEFQHKYSSINLYGLSQDPVTNNYIMVLKFADSGNLHEYIINNFETFNWKKKLFFLERISNELILIHKEGNVHRDFHHGNILIHDDNYPCISDLGLAGPANAAPEGNEIYGVLPYVAPEVLYGKQYTAAADIYSFGVIMTEISSGKPPHGGVPHDASLAIEISNGLRPKFGRGTPKVYIDLANQCMDADSSKRPT
ncbi:kinase-like domain-containing protein, partial [Gigaspora rosea]